MKIKNVHVFGMKTTIKIVAKGQNVEQTIEMLGDAYGRTYATREEAAVSAAHRGGLGTMKSRSGKKRPSRALPLGYAADVGMLALAFAHAQSKKDAGTQLLGHVKKDMTERGLRPNEVKTMLAAIPLVASKLRGGSAASMTALRAAPFENRVAEGARRWLLSQNR